MLWVGVASATVLLGSWYCVAVRPPKSRLCGSPEGTPVTAPRIRLRDGRYLTYTETGVPKDQARFKIIFCHGFGGSRFDFLRASTELMEEIGIYMVAFDRPGYVENDPDPRRSPKSTALDIEELAEALELGPKFYFISFSLGGHTAWASLKLAGVALLAPVINCWWPGFPKDLSREFYKKQDIGDQWTFRISHYAPWLLHWWINQSWLPSSTVIKGTTKLPNRLDRQIKDDLVSTGAFLKRRELATQQSLQESYLRDFAVMFGKWEFDPTDLPQPSFPFHLWQGDEDGLVPVGLQRYICSRLSWIKYHELPSTGHYLSGVPGFVGRVLKNLLQE